MKIALYLRVSTDKQETDNQAIQLREFSAKQGWQIVSEYTDYESGSKSDRAQFRQMFDDASRRKFDLVLFWALDRLSREGVLETLQHLNRLTSYGVGFRSYTEQFFDSCGVFKDAIIAIMATLAKQERVKRSERTKAGLARVSNSSQIFSSDHSTHPNCPRQPQCRTFLSVLDWSFFANPFEGWLRSAASNFKN